MEKKKQVHVEIPFEMHRQLSDVCTEVGQISILTRKLYRAFLRHMSIEEAGKEVANSWKEDE